MYQLAKYRDKQAQSLNSSQRLVLLWTRNILTRHHFNLLETMRIIIWLKACKANEWSRHNLEWSGSRRELSLNVKG
jgi:hypothetical protein